MSPSLIIIDSIFHILAPYNSATSYGGHGSNLNVSRKSLSRENIVKEVTGDRVLADGSSCNRQDAQAIPPASLSLLTTVTLEPTVSQLGLLLRRLSSTGISDFIN